MRKTHSSSTIQKKDSGLLSGKRAIVTGASQGIGFCIAKALVSKNVNTVICSRSKKPLSQAAEKLTRSNNQVFWKVCDVGYAAQVEELIRFSAQQMGGIDILINNAGVGIFQPVSEMTPEEWRLVMRTNLDSLFFTCHYTVPIMRRSGGGIIVNIGSLAGKNTFTRGAAYCSSKFGLKAFSEALMQEVRYDDIRVSYVMPGSVNTEFSGTSTEHNSWKLSAEDVAGVVIDILQRDPRCLTSRIEMRPSNPPK